MIAKLIDHTILSANADAESIKALCAEAREFGFFSVCVNPCNIELAVRELKGSDVKVCTVIGFPLGQNTTKTKVFETEDAVKRGADEIDMVINIAKLKAGESDYVRDEIYAIKKACGERVLKVIIETALLTDGEIAEASRLSTQAGADFVKTSTGFSVRGASKEDVEIIKANIGEGVKIKASGGIRDAEFAKILVDAGASRIGASKSVEIAKAY